MADFEVDADKLKQVFDPEKFMCKLTPMHRTTTALEHDIKTEGDYTTYYPYQEIEENLKNAGYDVLVFIASRVEDDSCITCGNAILGGSTIKGV